MLEPNIYRKHLYIQGIDETGNARFVELSPLSNSSSPLPLYQRIEVTGTYRNTITVDFGWGPEPFEIVQVYNTAFSGLELDGDFKVSRRIFQDNVNLGNNPRNDFGSNIGINNINFGSLDTAGFRYNIGDNNQLLESKNSVNLGNYNTINSGLENFNFGLKNESIDSLKTLIFGKANFVSGKKNEDINVFGKDNVLLNHSQSTVIGDENNLSSGVANLIFGDNNQVASSIYNSVIGERNKIDKTSTSDIYGDDNIVDLSVDFTLLGQANDLSGVNRQFVIGQNNFLNNNYEGVLIGDSNTINSQFDSFILGEVNDVNFGANNFILGRVNYSSGDNQNVILGKYNTTIFSTGDVILGKSNLSRFSKGNYNIGDSNQVIGSVDSFTIGAENTSLENKKANILGNNNFISGSQSNVIIGNGNFIGSGNRNSILLGINSTLTGKDSVNYSLNLGVFDTSLNIDSSNINLKSSNRPKINGQNIVISDDLAPYLTKNNGVTNSGTFNTFIINDPDYGKISSQIELQSFSYTNSVDSYYGSFEGLLNGLVFYGFTGYFRKRPTLAYNGFHSIFGDSYYKSTDEKFDILFSRSLEPLTGNWVLTPSGSLGILFANPSSNTGIFPTESWIVTGTRFDTATGLEPAPTFTYSNSYQGSFSREKLNKSQTYFNVNYNIYGQAAYVSTGDIAVIYGTPSSSFSESPAWLIVDKNTETVYYANLNHSADSTPQTGWIRTGYNTPLIDNRNVVNRIVITDAGTPTSTGIYSITGAGYSLLNNDASNAVYYQVSPNNGNTINWGYTYDEMSDEWIEGWSLTDTAVGNTYVNASRNFSQPWSISFEGTTPAPTSISTFGAVPSIYSLPAPTINAKISLGQQTGIMSSYDPVYGKIYIPFYY